VSRSLEEVYVSTTGDGDGPDTPIASGAARARTEQEGKR